jgi:hypothetical protein
LGHDDVIYDGHVFSKVDGIAINYTRDTYDLIIKVETMPPDAEVPKGLVDLLKKHGFKRDPKLAEQIQDYQKKFRESLKTNH